MQRKELGIAGIGSGRIGTLRARLAAKHPALGFLAISDLDPARARALAEQTGADFHTGNNFAAIERPEVSAVFDEPNYETSPLTQPAAPVADLTLLKHLRDSGIPVVAVFLTGRVRGVTPEIEASTAFAVAWLPGTEGGGVADVLFRKSSGAVNFPLSGKLSYAWPRGSAVAAPLFPYGYGLGGCNQH